jgi:thioredoxin reductase (NADPH)
MINKYFDMIIVGAGPAGISCAAEAVKKKLKILLLDKGNVVNSIINFPTNMTFFSTADLLEIANIPFNSFADRPCRIEAIKYYQNLINYFNIPVELNVRVEKIEKSQDKFQVRYLKRGEENTIISKGLILATGFYENPNLLNIPGEELHHVCHYFKEPYGLFKKDVVVVGGKNSAVEAALELYRHGVNVSIVHRRSEIKESVKYWILPDILNRIAEGKINAYMSSTVQRITTKSVLIQQDNKEKEIPADAVFLMTGYHPDIKILEACNIEYNTQTLEPKIEGDTLETNIEGLYLAGSIIAGYNANKIFIENSREHGSIIINDFMKFLKKRQ